MIRLINYFLKNSLVVNLITILIVVVGLISVYTLQKETFPTVEFDVVLVRTVYPGSSSEDVEKLVTIPIERELKGVAGIKNLNALSAEASSIIYLEVEPDEDINVVLDDIKNAVDSVVDLPEDVDKPKVINLTNKRRGIIQVALNGGTYDELRKYSKKLRDEIEAIPFIASANLGGYLPDQIEIKINSEKLIEKELTLDEVKNTLLARNLNLSAGSIAVGNSDVSIRTVAEFKNMEDIKDLVIRSNFSGQSVRLKDIATFRKGPDEKGFIQRVNGKRAIFMSVKMLEKGDILESVQKVRAVTDKFLNRDDVKKIGLEVEYVNDSSYYVKRRLGILSNNGILGIFLVFGCLLLFLNFSTSVITSLGAPIAFMTSFLIMQYLGISINLISMFALILVLGMLIDDSIILAEQFYQKIEDGMDPHQAAREAAIETIGPISATILTTVIAFGALFFMGGIMGKFLRPVPMVVIICLAASWLECFFLLPAHLKDFCKIKKRKSNKPHWFESVKNKYGDFLDFFLKSPWIVCAIFIGIFLFSAYTAKSMKFELFPGDDVRIAYFQIKGPVGVPIKETDNKVAAIEKLLMSYPRTEIKKIKSMVGTLIGQQGNRTGSHYGSAMIYLTPPNARERSTDEILDEIKIKTQDLIKPYEITITKVQGGPPKGKAIEIDISGDSLDELKLVSEQVRKKLSEIDGVIASEIDFEAGKKQILAKVNDAESKRLGVSTIAVASELRRAFAKDSVSEIRESDEDIQIKLMLDIPYENKLDVLSKLYVKNNRGQNITLGKVVDFGEAPGAFVIRRTNRKRIFSVSGTLDKKKLTPTSVAEKMKPEVKKIMENYPDLSYEFGGENKNTKESMGRLIRAAGIALVCIFFVLVVMFGSFGAPFVIMSAIPLGMIGVVWSFYAFDLALGFMATMGMVALVGVVVNDSIVLVNFIIKQIDKGLPIIDAVRAACVSRLRPVFLTTITTVAGLLPIAHAPGGDPFLKPMALSFAYGLMFATFVTLVFVPSFFIVRRTRAFKILVSIIIGVLILVGSFKYYSYYKSKTKGEAIVTSSRGSLLKRIKC